MHCATVFFGVADMDGRRSRFTANEGVRLGARVSVTEKKKTESNEPPTGKGNKSSTRITRHSVLVIIATLFNRVLSKYLLFIHVVTCPSVTAIPYPLTQTENHRPNHHLNSLRQSFLSLQI